MGCVGIECTIPPSWTANGWTVEGVVAALLAVGVILWIEYVSRKMKKQ